MNGQLSPGGGVATAVIACSSAVVWCTSRSSGTTLSTSDMREGRVDAEPDDDSADSGALLQATLHRRAHGCVRH